MEYVCPTLQARTHASVTYVYEGVLLAYGVVRDLGLGKPWRAGVRAYVTWARSLGANLKKSK